MIRVIQGGGGLIKMPANNMTPTGAFRVTVPFELSRIQRKTTLPFQAKHFTDDLDQLFLRTWSTEELLKNVRSINDNYIWPCTSIGILFRKSEAEPFQPIIAGKNGAVFLKPEDLGMEIENSFVRQVLKDGRTAYVPETKFERCTDFIWLPRDIMKLIEKNERIESTTDKDIMKKGWDLSALQGNIAPHSRSQFIMPISRNGIIMGLFTIGYEHMLMFTPLDVLDTRHIEWIYMLGDRAGLTLEKLLV